MTRSKLGFLWRHGVDASIQATSTITGFTLRTALDPVVLDRDPFRPTPTSEGKKATARMVALTEIENWHSRSAGFGHDVRVNSANQRFTESE